LQLQHRDFRGRIANQRNQVRYIVGHVVIVNASDIRRIGVPIPTILFLLKEKLAILIFVEENHRIDWSFFAQKHGSLHDLRDFLHFLRDNLHILVAYGKL